ncbi:MAG: indolepyruvate oxidoreductase subunit beta [Thermodesulfobacteriota bacterium]
MTTLIKDPLNLIITGVGGQGNVLASQLIGNVLVAKGYYVTIGETYGASQRGGPVMSHVRISERNQSAPLISEGKSDVILGLEPMETIRIIRSYGNPGIRVVVNSHPVHPLDVSMGNTTYPTWETIRSIITELSNTVNFLDATEIAMGLGAPILTNIVMVGALIAIEALPLKREDMLRILKETFSGQKFEINSRALRMGMEAVRNNQCTKSNIAV